MLFKVAIPPSNRNARFISSGHAFVPPYRHPSQQDDRVAVSVLPQSLNVGDRILMTEEGLQLVTKEGLRFSINRMPMQTGRFPSLQQRLSAPTPMIQQQGSISMAHTTRKPMISPSSSSSSFERDFSRPNHRQWIHEHLKRSNETRSPPNLISSTRPFPHLVSRSPSPVADVSEAAMERANPPSTMPFTHQHLSPQTPRVPNRNKRRPFRVAADSKRFFRKKNNKTATKKAAKKKAAAVDSLLSLASGGDAAGGHVVKNAMKRSGVISHRIKKSSSTA